MPLGLPTPLIANLFACTGVAYLFAHWLDYHMVELVLKPIPVLMLVAVLLRRSRGGASATLITLGLVASALGDVLLSWSEGAFIAGLVAFLVGHVLYLSAFVVQEKSASLLRLLPFALWTGGVFAVLYPNLGELMVPVGAYVAVITVMAWRASAMWGRVTGGGAALVGAALFVASDSLLAINKFADSFPLAEVAIMLTYWAGQLWIARSALPSAHARS